jgi:N-acetylglucosamine-6-phosphate deacetylase
MITRITNATVVTPGERINGASVIIEDAEIAEVLPAGTPLPDADETYDAGGAFLVPGFFDIHSHGAMGFEATDDDDSALPAICKAKLEEGVTSFFPTTLTLPHKALVRTMERAARYCESEAFCRVQGVHLEGPFVNPAAAGAQNTKFARKPDIEEVLRLAAIAPVSEMTFAVEAEGGADFAQRLLESGIVPSCGHSKATYAQFR